MKNVILSHDDKVRIYSVPDEVADNLDKYCWEFAANWNLEKPKWSKTVAGNKRTESSNLWVN